MESKVLLFDEEDTKVGETFMRRARQLVSQQRAEWIDESHSAIRFARDAEIEMEPAPAPETGAKPAEKNALYALAEKRIRERKRYILHSVLNVPMWIFIIGIIGGEGSEWEIAAFLFGCSFSAYAIHTWQFFKERLKNFRLIDRSQRHARQLAFEVDKLKRMGYLEKE